MLFLILLSLLSPAPEVNSKDLVHRLEARYRSAKTLQATFLQRYIEDGREVRSESGIAYFRRPGRMRWEYEVPEKNVFLVDGKTAWFYVPADHTVTRVPAKQSTDLRTPLALLAGEMKVSRVCAGVEASTEAPKNHGDIVLSCKPREADHSSDRQRDSSAQPQNAILFEIAPDTGELMRLLVPDPGGITIEFRFANWRIDPPMPDSIFRFAPPPGVAIVNGELPSGETPVN
jgi:outer membrane lipoprotein carrier protein